MTALTRAARRLLTPTALVLLLGPIQVVWLWLEQARTGSWTWLAAAAAIGVLLMALWTPTGWRLRLGLLVLAVVAAAVIPMVMTMATRASAGNTFELDGMIQAEVAVQKLLAGQPIYGISWLGTAMDPFAHALGGIPVRHHAHFPLVVLAAVPLAAAARLLGMGFDYRALLLLATVLGTLAVLSLPVPPSRRFRVLTVLFLNPLLVVFAITGHDDLLFVVAIICGIALISRGQLRWASLAFGVGVAFKPFAGAAAVALLLLLLRHRADIGRRQVVSCLVLLLLPAVLTMVPFLLMNPPGFVRDVFLFSNGGLPDSYPVTGFGLGGALLGLHLLSPGDHFPFPLFQLPAVALATWLGWRASSRGTNLRWFAGVTALVYLAFAFFARSFADNYAGALAALALVALVVGETPADLSPA